MNPLRVRGRGRTGSGFTMVELLITVSIIGIVTAAIGASLMLAVEQGPAVKDRSTFGGETAFLSSSISNDVANSTASWPNATPSASTCVAGGNVDMRQMPLYDGSTAAYAAEISDDPVAHDAAVAIYQVDVKRTLTLANHSSSTSTLLTGYCAASTSLDATVSYTDPTYVFDITLQAGEGGETHQISVTASRRGKVAGSFTLAGRVYGDADGDNVLDAAEPGLSGWSVKIYDAASVLQYTLTTDANGAYSQQLGAGAYTVCVTAQTYWTLSLVAGSGIVTCTGGTLGYTVNPVVYTNINFGEQSTGSNCNALTTRTVVVAQAVGGLGVYGAPANYHTVQAAYDAAKASAQTESLAILSNTTENIVMDGMKTMSVNQCGNAAITAADSSKPVFDITSTGALTVVSPDASGGTYGWLVETSGHNLKSIRATGASVAGIKVVGNNNSVNWNTMGNNAVGVEVSGSNNSLDGNSVNSNTAYGVHFLASANNNTIKTTINSNGSDGVFVEGTNNTLDSNKVSANSGDGFRITGAGNKLTGNRSNNGNSGGSNENGGAEYRFTLAAGASSSNKADNVNVPTAGKCPTWGTAGSVCE